MKEVFECFMYIKVKKGKTIIRKHMNYGERGDSNDEKIYRCECIVKPLELHLKSGKNNNCWN